MNKKDRIYEIEEHYMESNNIQQRIDLATKGFTSKLITHNFKKFVNLLSPYKEEEIIADIGCGFGYLMHFLPDNIQICGLDISYLSLLTAEKFREDYLKVKADAHNLPFRDDLLDKLFSISLTLHLLDVNKALKECFRILKPDGLAIITFLNKFGIANIPFLLLKIKFGYYFRYNIQTPSPQNNFSYRKMRTLVEKAGFEILETYGWGITFPYFLGQKIPQVAYKVTDYMIKIQDSPLIKPLSNTIIFKVRKNERQRQ